MSERLHLELELVGQPAQRAPVPQVLALFHSLHPWSYTGAVAG